MNRSSIYKHLDFMILDYICLIISFLIAYSIRIGNLSTLYRNDQYRLLLIVMILANMCVDFFTEPYKNILRRGFIKELKSELMYVLFNVALLSIILFVSHQGTTYSRLMISSTYLIFALISYMARQLRKNYIHRKSRTSIKKSNKKMLIISDQKHINTALDRINKYNFEMYEIDGICLTDVDKENEEINGYKVVANRKDVLSYICHKWIDEVFIAIELNRVPNEILKGLAIAGVSTNILINRLEEFEGQEQAVKKMFNANVLSTSVKSRSNYQIAMKRLMDLVGGMIGSLLTIILAVFLGPAIYLKSPGPIFYRQERIGLNGRKFYMYKFRSMVTNADELKESLMAQNRIKDGMMFKVKDDPRIIPGIGEFIRKTSLDEFPQFFNVVIGDMSLVGTRPPTVDEWVKYKLEHRIRMSIKPGITGLWQINGRSKITDFDKVIEYDTKYINNWSLALDIEILIKTVLVLLSKREDEAM